MLLDTALDVAAQIADGLSAVHNNGVIHRDIKSSNILVCDGYEQTSPRVKIIDFGLAQCHKMDGKTDAGSGTLAYMSPEQVRGEPVDRRTDVWSLGAVLYEMLSGRLPFAGGHREATGYLILNEDPPDLSSVRPGIPAAVADIVTKCLQKESAARYQQMEELRSELRMQKNRLMYSRNENLGLALQGEMPAPRTYHRIWLATGNIAGLLHAWL